MPLHVELEKMWSQHSSVYMSQLQSPVLRTTKLHCSAGNPSFYCQCSCLKRRGKNVHLPKGSCPTRLKGVTAQHSCMQGSQEGWEPRDGEAFGGIKQSHTEVEFILFRVLNINLSTVGARGENQFRKSKVINFSLGIMDKLWHRGYCKRVLKLILIIWHCCPCLYLFHPSRSPNPQLVFWFLVPIP